MITFQIKRHDTFPPLTYYVLDQDGLPVDLTEYTAVQFFMRARGETELKVNAEAEFEDKPNGVLRYAWLAADTDTAGVFFGEFELTGALGIKRTAPSQGLIRIEIAGDLDDA